VPHFQLLSENQNPKEHQLGQKLTRETCISPLFLTLDRQGFRNWPNCLAITQHYMKLYRCKTKKEKSNDIAGKKREQVLAAWTAIAFWNLERTMHSILELSLHSSIWEVDEKSLYFKELAYRGKPTSVHEFQHSAGIDRSLTSFCDGNLQVDILLATTTTTSVGQVLVPPPLELAPCRAHRYQQA
jgi:hypothetical protein